jgi:hypothetical protein
MSYGHASAETILRKLNSEDLFVPNFRTLLREIRAECYLCALKQKIHKSSQIQRHMKLPIFPFQKCCIDIIVLNKNSKDAPYGLSVLEEFSEFLEIFPIMDKTSNSVVKALTILIFKYSLGPGTTWLTDNGPEFTSLIFKNFMKTHGIRQSFISPYNSTGNSVERAHKLFRKHLEAIQSLADELDFTGPERLQLALASLNSKPKENLDYKSPTEILTGQQPNLIMRAEEFEYVQENYSKLSENGKRDAREAWNTNLYKLQQEIGLSNILRIQEKNSAIITGEIKEGDLVIIGYY